MVSYKLMWVPDTTIVVMLNHIKRGGWRGYGKVRKVKREVGERLSLRNLWVGKTPNTVNNMQKKP